MAADPMIIAEFFGVPLRQVDVQMMDEMPTDEDVIEYIWDHLMGEPDEPDLDTMIARWNAQ